MDKKTISGFVQDAMQIVDAHRKRAADPEYYRRSAIAIFALERARAALYDAEYAIAHIGLDQRHIDEINTSLLALEEVPLAKYEGLIKKSENSLALLSSLIASVTRLDLHKVRELRDRDGFRPIIESDPNNDFLRRPRKPYVGEALDLIEFWQKRTGEKVVSPKGFDPNTEEATQDSTEFMRLCLGHIDPTIDTSKTITIIRNALSFDAEVQKLLRELTRNGKKQTS